MPVSHHVHRNPRLATVPPFQLRNWKTGSEVAKADFAFKQPAGARQINLDELKATKDMGELPSHFIVGGQ